MKHILIITIALVLVACSKPQKTPYLTLKPDVRISGVTELYLLNGTYELFDKAIVDEENNQLYFIKDTVPEGIYQLRVDGHSITSLLISGTFPFSISGSFIANEPKLAITGNDVTKALWKCQEAAHKLNEEIDAITSHIPDSVIANDFLNVRDSIYQLINHSIDKKADEVKRFQKNYRSTLLPLLTAQLKAGNHYLFNRETEADYLFETSNQLTDLHPNYLPVTNFAMQMDSVMSQNLFSSLTKEGRTLPSVSIPNAWNQPVNLDTLIQQPTLLFLWKSTDEASRNISKQLMRWSRAYRRQGLQICMISLDDNKDNWLNAIKQDQLALLHLSDLLGEKSPILKDFGLASLPHLLLLDENRVVVKRTQELEELRPDIQQIVKN